MKNLNFKSRELESELNSLWLISKFFSINHIPFLKNDKELHRRKADEDVVFRDAEDSEKALELSLAEVMQFSQQNGYRLPFLTLIGLFITNYKKNLKMETFVASAGPKLASTNSEYGDWFFEELRSVYENQREIVSVCTKVTPDIMAAQNLQDINLCSTVYSKLAKLYSEWKGYIVPEAVSLLQIEEATGLIDSIINLAYTQPISKLSSHLSLVLQTGQSDSVTEQYLETTKFLETQFEALCGGVAESSETPGIMLIKLCNQMFGEITVRVHY